MRKLTMILELDKVRWLETMTKNFLSHWFLFIWSKHPLLNLIKVNILIKYSRIFYVYNFIYHKLFAFKSKAIVQGQEQEYPIV